MALRFSWMFPERPGSTIGVTCRFASRAKTLVLDISARLFGSPGRLQASNPSKDDAVSGFCFQASSVCRSRKRAL